MQMNMICALTSHIRWKKTGDLAKVLKRDKNKMGSIFTCWPERMFVCVTVNKPRCSLWYRRKMKISIFCSWTQRRTITQSYNWTFFFETIVANQNNNNKIWHELKKKRKTHTSRRCAVHVLRNERWKENRDGEANERASRKAIRNGNDGRKQVRVN